ncbi:MAG: S9 family peptidase [Gemmatimonadales bacterium]
MRLIMSRGISILVLCCYLLPATAGALAAQDPYKQPPPIVQRILDAPRLPVVSAAGDGRTLMLVQRTGLPSITDLAQPLLRLAGLRLNPKTNGRYSTFGYTKIALRDVTSGQVRAIETPDGVRLSWPTWSPDGARIFFSVTWDDRIEPWIADVGTGEAHRLATVSLNETTGSACEWVAPGGKLLCKLVVEKRGESPREPAVPAGPIVQRSEGATAPVRTYEDMLSSPYDEQLFAYYTTSQLALLDANTGETTKLGEPAIFLDVSPAPGGEMLLVTKVLRPFSYQVPVYRFAQSIEIWDMSGRSVETVADVAVGEGIPIGGVRTGPRNVRWEAGSDATLFYVEALDGGNTRRPAEVRDRVMQLPPPYQRPVELARLGFRYSGVIFGTHGLALLSERERKTRRMRTWIIDTRRPGEASEKLFDLSTEDRYNDPGSPVLARNGDGDVVLLQSNDGKWIYLRGAGASPDGDRPFLDRLNLDTKKVERVWQSDADVYASVSSVLDRGAGSIVIRREDESTPPNYFLHDVRSGREEQLTRFENPAPELASVRREIIKYQRADGVQLSGTLYYPTGYRDGTKVPVIFWIYPREFASAAVAGQVRGSRHRFVLPSGASHLFLLTQGYAVLDNPTLPVVGGDAANDTYQEQTVAGAKAAVEALIERGVADGNFGVGGHSYGAFATANLLAHSDLFKAGVARSGAYNRTLTPFGFQAEQRTFWQAKDLYLKMMPFSYADKINEPLLLTHGMNDNNSGTFPIQSQRMYHALKGHGAVVEYVQLPFESHGYRARESVGDVVARMIEWYDRYVKGGGKPKATTSSSAGQGR